MRLFNALPDNTRGILATCVAMAGFVTNDTCVKLAAADLPIGQLIAMRGVAAVIFMVAMGFATGAIKTMPTLRDKAVGLRAVGEVVATLLFYNALVQIPLANANAVLQTIPLAVTAAAALLFGEKVGWRRWLVIFTGFAGVVLIIQPGGEGFQLASLWAVAAVAFFVLRDMSTRHIDKRLPSVSINITTSFAVMIAGFALAFFEPWQIPSMRAVFLMILAAMILSVAYVAMTIAMRSGDVSVTSPFRYSIVLWALLIDLLVFGNTPGLSMIIGMCVVVGSGFYMIFRERQLRAGQAKEQLSQDSP